MLFKMNTLSRVSSNIHSMKAFRMLGKCRSLPGSSNLQFFTYSSRTPGLLQLEQPHFLLWKRCCSSQDQGKRFPDLTDFPIYVRPNVFSPIKNRFMSSLVIRRYFDEQFDLDKFVEASKQAVVCVSGILAQGKLHELNELVTPDVLEKITENIKKFSLTQRMALEVDKRDIFACYTHNVGIIMPVRKGQLIQTILNERFVQITMSYHVLKGLGDMDASIYHGRLSDLEIPDFEKNVFVLNYRFIKNYSSGLESDWIINGLNHFKPLEEWQDE